MKGLINKIKTESDINTISPESNDLCEEEDNLLCSEKEVNVMESKIDPCSLSYEFVSVIKCEENEDMKSLPVFKFEAVEESCSVDDFTNELKSEMRTLNDDLSNRFMQTIWKEDARGQEISSSENTVQRFAEVVLKQTHAKETNVESFIHNLQNDPLKCEPACGGFAAPSDLKYEINDNVTSPASKIYIKEQLWNVNAVKEEATSDDNLNERPVEPQYNEDMQDIITCDNLEQCSMSVIERHTYTKEMEYVGDFGDELSAQKVLHCESCGKKFISPRRLRIHKFYHCRQLKSFKCDFCGKCFSILYNLRQHILIHMGEKPFTCNVCSKSFTHQQNFRSHALTHTDNKPFKCDICHKNFRRRQHLQKHASIHRDDKSADNTVDRSFICDICQKSFRYLRNLQRHYAVHTDLRPFKCDICEKSFRYRQGLLGHSSIHTGKKPFKCHVCEKCFRRREHLQKHVSVHSDDKPFKCDICDKNFRRLDNFRQHRLVHTAPKTSKCGICEKTFRKKNHLLRHSLTHTADKLFKC
ncbi:zinc finger protein 454-like [Periplaneta americana]|uniref:zinc finger protein 454-like n=1 Tax=Periplaneta americana TaxID=6978 RepID=UPI0037E70068